MNAKRPSPDRPVFDAGEWRIVRRAVEALHDGDVARFTHELSELKQVTLYADRSVMYVNFALLYQSAKRAGKVPTQSELHDLATRAEVRYARYTQPGAASLGEILETAWNLRRPHAGTKGNMYVILGCVGLAALIDEPQSDLDDIEAELRAWIADDEGNLATIVQRIEDARS